MVIQGLKPVANHVGVPQRTLSRWLSHNDISGKMAKIGTSSHNIKAGIVAKPTSKIAEYYNSP